MSGRRPKSFAFCLILKSTTVQLCLVNFFAVCHFTSTVHFRLLNFFAISHFTSTVQFLSLLFCCLSTFSTLFDPTIIPIRSCLRIDDELVSNYGPVHHKHVRFSDSLQYFGDITPNSTDNLTLPPLSRPRCWRIKPRNPISELVKSGQVYSDPYSIWDLCSSTPIVLNNYQRPERMKIECDVAEVYSPKPNTFPIFWSLRNPNSKRKGLRVKFSFLETSIFPDGGAIESVTATEEPSEFWKPGALDGEPFYKMNCQNLICF